MPTTARLFKANPARDCSLASEDSRSMRGAQRVVRDGSYAIHVLRRASVLSGCVNDVDVDTASSKRESLRGEKSSLSLQERFLGSGLLGNLPESGSASRQYSEATLLPS